MVGKAVDSGSLAAVLMDSTQPRSTAYTKSRRAQRSAWGSHRGWHGTSPHDLPRGVARGRGNARATAAARSGVRTVNGVGEDVRCEVAILSLRRALVHVVRRPCVLVEVRRPANLRHEHVLCGGGTCSSTTDQRVIAAEQAWQSERRGSLVTGLTVTWDARACNKFVQHWPAKRSGNGDPGMAEGVRSTPRMQRLWLPAYQRPPPRVHQQAPSR